MIAEFTKQLNGDVLVGLAQAAGAIMLCLAVVALCRRFAVRVEREAAISIGRGLLQMVAVGMVLALLLRGNLLIGAFILLLMTVAAAMTASRRLKGVAAPILIAFWAILAGAGVVIAFMLATGTLESNIAVLVPVGSMIIANAMNTNALALERFRSEVESHVGEIESALALGAAPEVSVSTEVEKAFSASLIPALNNLRSLGLVWIPGLMAGMVLSGSSPLYAAIYQFVVIAMIFGSSGLTALIGTNLIRKRIFTQAEQLALVP